MKSINSKALSWIAIILSVIAMIITWLRVEVTIENDTFVGLMAGFMGACATILVGVQIYNSIDTRNKIETINKTFDEKIDKLNSNYDLRIRDINVLNNNLSYELETLKKELQQAKVERETNEKKMEISVVQTRALAFVSTQPLSSFANFYKCLCFYLEKNDAEKTRSILKNMASLVNIIDNNYKKGIKLNIKLENHIRRLNYESIKKYPIAELIKEKYIDIHNKLIDIIQKQKENEI